MYFANHTWESMLYLYLTNMLHMNKQVSTYKTNSWMLDLSYLIFRESWEKVLIGAYFNTELPASTHTQTYHRTISVGKFKGLHIFQWKCNHFPGCKYCSVFHFRGGDGVSEREESGDLFQLYVNDKRYFWNLSGF